MKTLKPLSNTNHAIKLQGVFLNELPTVNPKNDHNPFGKLQLLEMQLYVDCFRPNSIPMITARELSIYLQYEYVLGKQWRLALASSSKLE